MKKIIIVGGGIAGLSAGIYAQKNGFESVIYERHAIVGGECTSWKRKGFLLDNCVHWLTGTNPDKEIYQVWKEVGVLGNGVEVIQHESFLQVEHGGQHINIWCDSERLRADMLALSPEDAEATNEFIDVLNTYKSVVLPSFKPKEQMSLLDVFRLLKKMKKLGPIHRKYSKLTIDSVAERFKHPLLRKLVTVYMPETYNAASLFYVFATFCDGNGALPRGGSQGMVDRMVALYEQLGGQIVVGKEVVRMNVNKDKVESITLKNGEVATADYIIAACDTDVLFNRLLNKGYMDKYFKEHYNNYDKHPLYSTLNCYIGVDGKMDDMPITVAFDCEPYKVCDKEHSGVVMKNFDYEPSFSPEGKSLIQTLLVQNEKDYDYWEALNKADRAAYKQEKRRVADDIVKRIEERYPHLRGKLEVLDVVTPLTYTHFCNAYKGAYMSFILSPKAKKTVQNGRVPGLKNLVLAGQWLQPPGGLPNAVVTGRFAVQRICKLLKQKFQADCL